MGKIASGFVIAIEGGDFHREYSWRCFVTLFLVMTLPERLHSQGKTREEAVQNIREAIKGYVAALEEDGLSVFQAEIQEARTAYQAGDYVTLDEYVAQRKVRV